ncbi:MAG: GntR family transcriptional regulator [Chloroflexi bacterium]|nr:GntR family transcriptional regulator [Chloroflexota bacterium]
MDFETHLGTSRINKDLPIPYYYQIAQDLREMIEDIGVDPDSEQREIALPSEIELSTAYQVTRGTVRHALELLEREGLIYREKGRGTFLSRRRVQLDLRRLCSTTEDMKARGWKTSTQVLSVTSLLPSIHMQQQLRIADGDMVWEVNRLRLADGEPLSLQWAYLPCRRTPKLDQLDLTGSLYYALKDQYNIELRTANQVIRARVVSEEEADLLQSIVGDPVFVLHRTSFDQNGQPVEYLNSLWRADRYDLEVQLTNV